LILDSETTGFDNAEIVEIAVINPLGEALLNTLVRPAISIPAEVR
jgi:DNA polymerase-3 subunit epsilon